MHFRPRCVNVDCLRVSFGWLMSLGRIVRGCITEFGRGGACVPARVALQGRIYRSNPRAQCVYSWYGNAAARTFGRAHRHRPYGFVWVDCVWVVLFVCWLVKTVHMNQHHRCCTFDSPGLIERSEIYPGQSRRAGTYAIGIVLFKINLHVGDHSFAACGDDVR